MWLFVFGKCHMWLFVFGKCHNDTGFPNDAGFPNVSLLHKPADRGGGDKGEEGSGVEREARGRGQRLSQR